MKKFVSFLIAIFISTGLIFTAIQKSSSETVFRNYKSVKLAKGSFLKGISQRDISTATVKVGDVEYFINPADVFVGSSNVIPKNSVFLGEVEEVVEAVEGINASMKIRIYKVITPEKIEYALNANVYRNGSINIGGDLSEVAYYTRMPHYPGTWKHGTLQYVPTTIREMGHPTVIRAGDEVTFIMNEDQSLYKPLP